MRQGKFLPRCPGDCIVAIAMTEPGTGSDLQGIKTSAVDKGDHYLEWIKDYHLWSTSRYRAGCVEQPDPSAGAKV